MMQDVMTTFDAIRGLPATIAEQVASIIWEAAKQDQALREALEDATQDFLRWENEVIKTRYSTFLNERGSSHFQGQDDQLLADIPW